MDYTDVIGKRFHQIVVLSHSGTKLRTYRSKIRGVVYTHEHYYRCQCDCGHTFEMLRSNIQANHKHSCGCLRRKENKVNWRGYGEISGSMWNSTRQNALSRNLPITLTIEEAWSLFQGQQGCCALTGLPLLLCHNSNTKEGRALNTASLDRIDSSKGYIWGNVQWVHKKVNQMKGNLKEPHFQAMCRAVAREHTQ